MFNLATAKSSAPAVTNLATSETPCYSLDLNSFKDRMDLRRHRISVLKGESPKGGKSNQTQDNYLAYGSEDNYRA